MNLATIEMPVQEARKKFLEYREAVKGRHYEEDAAIMQGYRALAKGKRLLRMSETIQSGGFDGRGLPKLALAKADGPWKEPRPTDCFVRVERLNASQRRVIYSPKPLGQMAGNAGLKAGVSRFVVHVDEDITVPFGWTPWQAIVPLVPPDLRPKTLAPYHVLFEATWFQNARRIKGDPALVKHLGGDLWVVVATWDLTPLERAVLSQ